MASGTDAERCEYVFDPEQWRATHDAGSTVSTRRDEDILTDVDGTLVWECPHPAEDGADRCLFHQPIADRTADADAVAEFVAIVNDDPAHENAPARPAQFIGARFEQFAVDCDTLGSTEDIDLRHAHAERVAWDVDTVTVGLDARGLTVDGQVQVVDTTVEADVELLGATFRGETDLRETTVGTLQARDLTCEGDADLRGVTCNGDLTLTDATFEGTANLQDLTVDGQSRFTGATFEHGASLQIATFGSRASFRGATFASRTTFNDATFGGEADFRDATIEWPTCIGTTFEGRVDFEGATLDAAADFRTATFEAEAEFQQAEVYEGKFQEATFHGEVDFERATFEWARFADATFDEAVTFDNACLKYLDMTDAVFHASVSFQTRLADQLFPVSPFQGRAELAGVTVHGVLDVRVLDTDGDVVASELPTFSGEADFTGADVADAEFAGVSFAERGGLTADDPPVTFADADLSGATLRDADCTGVDFTDTDLTNATCRDADFGAANLEGAVLSRANLYDADFTDARLYGAIFGDARINDGTRFVESGSWWTWLPTVTCGMQTIVDDPRTAPTVVDPAAAGEITSLSRAASVYTQLERLATANAATELASTCFRWRKDVQRIGYRTSDGEDDTGGQWIRYVFSKLTNVGTRYGDSPWRVVTWSAVVMAVSSLLYAVMDGVVSAQPDGVATPEWVTPIYFSIVTFTTLGFGDFQPAGQWTQLLASVESLLGALLLALLIAVLGRRATR